MTDAELIELVETRIPQELTAAEVAELGQRLKESPALQQALAERLEMERYLADALGRVSVSPDKVLERASQTTTVPSVGRGWRPAVALSLLLGVALAVGLTWRLLGPGGDGARPEDGAENIGVAGPGDSAQGQPEPGDGQAVRRSDPTPGETAAPTKDPHPVTVEPPRKERPGPYAMVDLVERAMNEEELKAWFVPVEGQPHNIRHTPEVKLQSGAVHPKAAVLGGVWRLRPAWKDGAALRTLFRTADIPKLHIWNGMTGVTLELWRAANSKTPHHDLALAAYHTTRKATGPRPDTLVLAAVDEGEFVRTRMQMVSSGYARVISTPIDLRHEDGLLTISSGDVRILSVPFAAPPTEVYFDGEACFQSLGFVPLIPLAPFPPPLPTVLDVEKPAELKWVKAGSGELTAIENQPDGSLKLSAEKTAQRVATFLPPQGVCEVIVQVEGATAGTGVYLGDENGQVRYQASFLRDEETGRTLVQETAPEDTASSVRFSPASLWPPAFVADKVWLRLLVCCGGLKCWVSSDGVHWARAFESSGGSVQPWTSVGLFCQAGEGRRSIRLRRLMLRELRSLNSLAPAELVRKAPLIPHGPRTLVNDWLAAFHAFRPADVDPVVWSRACAIRALAGGVPPPLGLALLENLLDHGMEQPTPFKARLQLLDEALRLVPRSRGTTGKRYLAYYERLGRALQWEGEARPYSRLRQALDHNPVLCQIGLSGGFVHDAFPEALAVSEMLDLAAAGNWEEVEALARIGCIRRTPPSIFDWAVSLTGSGPPSKRTRGPGRPISRSSWQAPVVLEQDKEATNDLGEIETALHARELREAGRMITHLKGRGDRVLLPDSGDAQRLMSWPVALQGLLEATPDLRGLLRKEFAAEARLQLRRALDEEDELALESLALRYPGTDEAAEALLWLGDRQLLDGDLALAVGRYRQAQGMAEGALRRRLEDRLQLTAALLGRPALTPLEADIEFGATRLSPAALEALRQKRRDAGVDLRWAAGLPPQLAPVPTALDVEARGRFEGEMGDQPDVPLPLPIGQRRKLELDWFARQVAVVADGNRLFVSNRFQVDCFELSSGKLLWCNALSRDGARKEQPAWTYEYPLIPMRPVVAGSRLYVRRLTRDTHRVRPSTLYYSVQNTIPGAPMLACLDTATGKVVWNTTNHLAGGLHYVSDPLVVQDQVFAIGQKQLTESNATLVLLIHNRSDGALLAERPLLPIRASFDQQRGCQLTALEDCCIATVGGSVLCFDFAGNLRWVRRTLWIPVEADAHWVWQSQEPPLVAGGRCFIVQPGVLNLVCLAPESGQLHWQRAIYGLRRLVALAGDRLIVQTDYGFLCLDAASGKEVWSHEAAPVLAPPLCAGPGGLLYATTDAVPGEKEMYRPNLVWVDLETGRQKVRFPLNALRQAQPRLGPLLVVGGRLWAFAGKGDDLLRDLIELVPNGPLLPSTPPSEWEVWTHNDPGASHAAARVLPGWTVFQMNAIDKTGLMEDFQGQRSVLRAAAPFVIGRHLDVPDTDKPRLLLRVRSEAKAPFVLAMDIDGKRLAQQAIASAPAEDPWKGWEVDLSAYKGQRLWVVVRQLPHDDAENACSFWAKIELQE